MIKMGFVIEEEVKEQVPDIRNDLIEVQLEITYKLHNKKLKLSLPKTIINK